MKEVQVIKVIPLPNKENLELLKKYKQFYIEQEERI